MAWTYGSYNYPSNLKAKEQARIKKNNAKTVKSLAPYKNPIFPTRTEVVTLTTKGGRPKKVKIEVQDVELEKAVRKTQRAYGQYSNRQKIETGKGEGKARVSKAVKIYKTEGRQAVLRWTQTLYSKAKNIATLENSQDLWQAVDSTCASYDELWEIIDWDDYDEEMDAFDSAVESLRSYVKAGLMSYDEKKELISILYSYTYKETPEGDEGLDQWHDFLNLLLSY